jgi:hypothetical protein
MASFWLPASDAANSLTANSSKLTPAVTTSQRISHNGLMLMALAPVVCGRCGPAPSKTFPTREV